MKVKYYFICFLLLAGCHNESKKKETPVEVLAMVVEPKTIPLDLEFIGVVQSSHTVEIRSRVEGYLNKIDYTEGAFVKEGDLLFQIDPRQYEDAVKEAQANLEKEQAALWQAQQAVGRYKPLFEQKAASRKDLDDATAQLLSAQASVNLFQARLDEANLNLSFASITSPISGITSSAKFQEGSFISPSANGVLTTVSVLDPIWVVVNVSESYFLASLEMAGKGDLIIPGNYNFDVSITLSDGSPFPYTGKVSFISPLYDQSTGTLSARGVFKNPNNLLKPGQFVKVKAMGAKQKNAILVPQSSVQQGIAGQFVYIIDEEGRAESKLVETGDWYEQSWIIKSGLKKGDKVITAGINKIKDGTPVKVKKSKS